VSPGVPKVKEIEVQPPRELGVLVNHKTVFNTRATGEKLRLALSAVPLDRALMIFGGMSVLAYNFKGSSFYDFQKGVVNELGAALPYATQLIAQLKPPGVFVSLEQLAVLQKIAILYCAPEGSSMPLDFGDRILRAMLLYNSLRGLEDIDMDDKQKAFLTVELRNMFTIREDVAVNIDLYGSFFEWAESDRGRRSKHFMPVNEEFEQFFGLTYIEYAAAAMAFYSYYLSLRNAAEFPVRSPFLNMDSFISPLSSQTPIRRWLMLNAMSVADAKAAFAKDTDAFYSGLSLHCFRARPMVYVSANIAYVPHLPFLDNRLGSGLYFTMLDAYNWAYPNEKRSNLFTSYFADYFEQRCVSVMREAHPSPNMVFGEQQYKVGKQEKNSTDLVIIEGNSAVFIDVSTTRLNLESTLIGLDDSSINRDIEKVVDNAKQMTGRIKDFKAGYLVYESNGCRVDPSKIEKIYPVALTIAPIPRLLAFNNRIFARLREKGYLQDCEQLETYSAEDFDLLLRLIRAGCLVSDVLDRKLNRETQWIRMSSLKNYLMIHDDDLRQRANSKPWPGLGEWLAKVMDTLRSWGLPAKDSTGIV
jgi:hypothetical protein